LLGSGTGLAHNTSGQFITIYYPFHPLVGQRFRPIRVDERPQPSFRVQLSEWRLTIPVWMTKAEAANCRLGDVPQVAVADLLEMADLLTEALAALRPGPDKMREDSVTTEDRIDGRKNTPTTSQDGRHDRSVSGRGAGAGHASHGEAAPTSAARGGKTGSPSRRTKRGGQAG